MLYREMRICLSCLTKFFSSFTVNCCTKPLLGMRRLVGKTDEAAHSLCIGRFSLVLFRKKWYNILRKTGFGL